MLAMLIGIIMSVLLLYSLLPAVCYKYTKRYQLGKASNQPELMLTFDDGPDSHYTAALLDVLKQHDVKAVFFVVVNKALKQPDLVQRMLDEGHMLGVHSMRHSNGLWMTPGAVKRDFAYSAAVMTGKDWPVAYYRPPWGWVNLATLYYVGKHHYRLLLWSVMAQDWNKKHDDDEILRRLLARSKNGSIICLHDSGEDTGGDCDAAANTLAAVMRYIPLMQSQGYRFILPEAQ